MKGLKWDSREMRSSAQNEQLESLSKARLHFFFCVLQPVETKQSVS